MSVKDNLELVSKAMEQVFNGHDQAAIDLYWAASYIQHNEMAKPGREGFREFVRQILHVFPDVTYEYVLPLVGSGDQVWAYGKNSGTFTHDWMGIKANGKRVTFPAVDIFRIENGRIAEHWDVVDYKAMFDQMA